MPYFYFSSFRSAYHSRLETLKLIAHLKPRRQRVKLKWMDESQSVKDQPTDLQLSKWRSLPVLEIGKVMNDPLIGNAESTKAKKKGKLTLKKQWSQVFTQRLGFIKDKLDSRNNSENTTWKYQNCGKNETIKYNTAPNTNGITKKSRDGVTPSLVELQKNVLNELSDCVAENESDTEEHVYEECDISSILDKNGLNSLKKPPPPRPPPLPPMYKNGYVRQLLAKTPSSVHNNPKLEHCEQDLRPLKDYVSSAVEKQKLASSRQLEVSTHSSYTADQAMYARVIKPCKIVTSSDFRRELQQRLMIRHQNGMKRWKKRWRKIEWEGEYRDTNVDA